MRTAATQLSLVLALGAIASCSGPSPAGRTQCGTSDIGVAGGVVTSPSGASVAFARDVLTTSVTISVCVVEQGRVPHQRSPMIEFAPSTLPLRGSVAITMPSDTVSGVHAELRAAASDLGASVFDVTPAPGGGVVFSSSTLGAVRIMDIVSGMDAGPFGQDAQGLDVNRSDAPRPVGPVVVGPDLTPADYACLGMIATPPMGAPTARTLHVIDWADRGARAGYLARTFPTATWDTSGSCTGYADCSEGTSDASGSATLLIDSGPVWVNVSSPTPTTPSHTASLQWVAGLIVPESATSVEVPVLSQQTQNAITSSTGFSGPMILGHVRDCSDALVQRVRVRLFGAMSGGEILFSPLGGRPITYGNGLGFPAGVTDRTTLDGVYLALNNGVDTDIRVEAWGHLALGGQDVLLSCERVSLIAGQPVLVDMRPLRSSIPSACGSVP